MNNKKRTNIVGLQTHYTSCHYGFSGHAGFQTRAISRDINPGEQRAVERLGIYQPPRNLPTEPEQEKIDSFFPKVYRSTYLETGRLAIIRSVYVGQDYTRRWGNYFSHSLIIECLPDDIWPVDLYEWNGWKDKLLPTEDTENASFELPAITLIPDEEAYAFRELHEFINEDNDRKNQLASMIQAVFMRKETSRNIVIREELETSGLFWIACIQKSFPPSHQKELGCSSFQFDPRACLAVNVTLGETDFVLDENERKYQFYVFDFVDGKQSHIDSLNEYAVTISTWMTEQPERLQQFYDFTKRFEHDTLNNELVSMLHLFQLSLGVNLALGKQDLVNLLTFASSYTKKEYFAQILQIIGSVEKLTSSENLCYIKHLAEFFIKGASATNDREYRQLSYQLIIRLFDQALFNDDALIDELNALRSQAKKAFAPSYDREFSTLFLSESHLSKITSNMQGLPPKKLSFALKELIVSIQALGTVKVYEDDNLLWFVKSAILAKVPKLSQLKWLMGPFIEDHLAIANLCIYISKILVDEVDTSHIAPDIGEESKRAFATFLSNLFEDKGAAYRFKIINTMKQNRSTWQILEAEWKNVIAKSRDKVSDHATYYQQVLQDRSEFSQHYQPVLAAELWQLLSKKEQQAQAITWIRDKQTESFPIELVKTIFQTASDRLSFNPKDKQSDIYDILVVQVKQSDIVLCPNRLVLRDTVLKANVDDFDFDKQQLKEIQSALTGVDDKTYKEFSQLYLPLILSRITEREQHGLVIKAVFCSEQVAIFKQSYGLFYDKRPSKQFNDADNAALMFWLDLKSDDEDYQTFQLIEESAIDFLSSRIAKLKNDKYQVLLRNIKSKMKSEVRKKWEQIYSQAEEKRNSLLGSFLRKWRR
jgi:hypothetical protein